MPNNTEKGMAGEEIAIAHLLKHGYRIRERNWHHRHLEVDIIAETGNLLVIVEVKLRAGNAFGMPEAFVTKTKQQNLIRAAEVYIRQHQLDLETRFDIVSIIHNARELQVDHIVGAFYPTL